VHKSQNFVIKELATLLTTRMYTSYVTVGVGLYSQQLSTHSHVSYQQIELVIGTCTESREKLFHSSSLSQSRSVKFARSTTTSWKSVFARNLSSALVAPPRCVKIFLPVVSKVRRNYV